MRKAAGRKPSSSSRRIRYHPQPDWNGPSLITADGKLKTFKGSYSRSEINRIDQRIAEEARAGVAHLDAEDRRAIRDMHADASWPADDGTGDIDMDRDWETTEAWTQYVGGDREEAIADIEDELARLASRSAKRYDPRTWGRRRARHHEAWMQQLELLTDTYLEQKACDMPLTFELLEGQESFPIALVTFDGYSPRMQVPLEPNELRNITLVKRGYLGSVPVEPHTAVSLQTLEQFRCLRLAMPSTSVQGFVKAMCIRHNVPYRRSLRTHFSDAWEVYLQILFRVDARINKVLGRDTPNWRMLNSCPCCNYKLQGEPELPISQMFAMDGNNSLKRAARAAQADDRIFPTDYFLSPDYVDQYADEVRKSKGKQPASGPEAAHAQDAVREMEEAVNGHAPVRCSNWKNVTADEHGSMPKVFSETGVFLCSCRHLIVSVIADMRQSGELAKYPLAILSKILEVHGDHSLIFYDIGCSFSGTAGRSSLGDKVRKTGTRFAVGSFHGYAHNRLCQLDWHPLYLDGVGLEDGEPCERIFSGSNALARLVRYASMFLRTMYIVMYFAHWDEIKYSNLGDFIYGNYRDALAIIRRGMPAQQLDAALMSLLTQENFREWLRLERDHLAQPQQEAPQDTAKISYVDLLIVLEQANNKWNDVLADQSQPSTSKEAKQYQLRWRQAYEGLTAIQQAVAKAEEGLMLQSRWTRDSPEWKAAEVMRDRRKYQAAVDELERLVVMRLFELEKLSLQGTGYKLREKIGKALKDRSARVSGAMKRVNALAAKLDPPLPALDFPDLIKIAHLGEFSLLSECQTDIREQTWAQPFVREATRAWLKIERAKEEIQRLDVEVARLRAAMRDEKLAMSEVLWELDKTNRPLAAELSHRLLRRIRIHERIRTKLDDLCKLEGYGGGLQLDTRVAGTNEAATVPAAAAAASQQEEDVVRDEEGQADAEEEDEENEDLADEMDRLSVFFGEETGGDDTSLIE